MKKKSLFIVLLTSVFACIFISSCSKEEEPTTYVLHWNTSSSYINYVNLCEYAENGDRIAINTVNNVANNGTYQFEAQEKAVKVKVFYKSTIGRTDYSRWVQQVYYLKLGSNIVIEVNDETMVGASEP